MSEASGLFEDGQCVLHGMEICVTCSAPRAASAPAPRPLAAPRFRRAPFGEGHEHGASIVAQFPGFCVECREPIEPGEKITKVDDERWAHSECL